jgi:hypothetical protein
MQNDFRGRIPSRGGGVLIAPLLIKEHANCVQIFSAKNFCTPQAPVFFCHSIVGEFEVRGEAIKGK